MVVLEVAKTVVADMAQILIDPAAAAVAAMELADERPVATMDVVHDEAIEKRAKDEAAAIAGAPIDDSRAASLEERE